MKKLAPVLLRVAALVVFALAGCSSSSLPSSSSSGSGSSPTPTSAGSVSPSPTSTPSAESSGNTITMTSYVFTQRSITVQSSQPVVFDDLAGTHPLCVGTGFGGTNACDTASQAPNVPAQLVGTGIILNPGDKVSITFKPGNYHIICTVHPGMFIDVTVQ